MKNMATTMARRSKRIKDKNLNLEVLEHDRSDRPWLKKVFINDVIGYGVFTTKEIKNKEFIVEYNGDLISSEEGDEREKKYNQKSALEIGSFLYWFDTFCIDATYHESLGKYVNDSSKPNSKMNIVYIQNKPHLLLYALSDIPPYTEIRYNYGANGLWWRKFSNYNKSFHLREPMSHYVTPSSPTFEKTHVKVKSTALEKKVTHDGTESPLFSDDSDFEDTVALPYASVINALQILESPPISDDSDFEDTIASPYASVINALQILEPQVKSTALERKDGKVKSTVMENNFMHNSTVPMSQDDVRPTSPTFEKKNVRAIGTAMEKKNVKVKSTALEKNAMRNSREPTSHDDIQPTLPTLEKENVEVKGTASETNVKVKTAALENNAMHNSTEPTSHDDIPPTLPTLEKENVQVKSTALETKNVKVKTTASENNAMHNSTGDGEHFIDYLDEKALDQSFPPDIELEQSAQLYCKKLREIPLSDVKSYRGMCLEEEDDSDYIPTDDDMDQDEDYDDSSSASQQKDIQQNDSGLNRNRNVAVTVARCKKAEDGSRVYDSYHTCLFCSKEFVKISRHLTTVHRREEEIVRIAALPKREREVSLELIRNRGNFYHNMKVLQIGGELKVYRRPLWSDIVISNSYTPCTSCLGFFLKQDLWRHSQRCVAKSENAKKGRKLIHESSMLLHGGCTARDKGLWDNVISTMRQDEVTDIVKKDELIISFGAFMFSNKGVKKKWYISQKMRILARLLKQLNEGEQTFFSLIELMKPSSFDKFVQATKDMCTLMEGQESPEFKIPSLALKIGYAIKKAAVLGRGVALRKHDRKLVEDLQFFVELIDTEWSTRISSVALNTLTEKAFSNHEILPLTEDLIKLKGFMLKGLQDSYIKLRNKATVEEFRVLEEFCSSRILTFNKRRSNEACKVTITQFNERAKWKSRLQEVTDSLKPLELELSKRMEVLYLRGKRGNKVPILMTKDIIYSMELLIKTRKEVGVPDENPYVFPAPTRTSLNHLRGNDNLSAIVKRCPMLKSPELVKSTKLRKYIGTVTQILNLEANELEWLARHMGHDINIHKQYYRLADSTIELAQVSKLLLAIDEGKAGDFRGKSLDSITLEEIPDVTVDEEDDDASIDFEVESEEELEVVELAVSDEDTSSQAKPMATPKATPKSSKRNTKGRRRSWSPNELAVLYKAFHKYLNGSGLPGKSEIDAVIASNPVLKERTWSNVKDCVRNQKKRARKHGVFQ